MMHRLTLVACIGATLLTAHGASGDETTIVPTWEHCVVNVATWDRLNVRNEPGAGGEIVARYRHGDCGIMVTGECVGEWCPIEDGLLRGWVNSRFISMVSPAMYCMNATLPEGEVLRLRAYPSDGSGVVMAIPSYQCNISALPYSVAGWQKVRVESEGGDERHEGWIPWGFLMGQ